MKSHSPPVNRFFHVEYERRDRFERLFFDDYLPAADMIAAIKALNARRASPLKWVAVTEISEHGCRSGIKSSARWRQILAT